MLFEHYASVVVIIFTARFIVSDESLKLLRFVVTIAVATLLLSIGRYFLLDE